MTIAVEKRIRQRRILLRQQRTKLFGIVGNNVINVRGGAGFIVDVNGRRIASRSHASNLNVKQIGCGARISGGAHNSKSSLGSDGWALFRFRIAAATYAFEFEPRKLVGGLSTGR